MAWRFIKQPNGLLARFSEVVDDFTDINLTVDEARKLCVEEHGMSREDANNKIARAFINEHRFSEAIEDIRLIHGESAAFEAARQFTA